MKFFIPESKDEKEAESVYKSIATFISAEIPEDDQRIYSITYIHNGERMSATVGKDCDSYYNDPMPKVIAIFKSTPYKVCLANRGVIRGEAILVGGVLSESFFE